MAADRREFLLSLGATVVGGSVLSREGSAERLAEPVASGKKPNVIFMICDDLGYGDLGCYGSQMPTPRLDRLAAEGTRCTHHNTPHAICSASRSAIMTGRYAARTHTAGAYMPNAKGTSLEETLLPQMFKESGYTTHAIGKWHLGDLPGYRPTERGFDSYLGVWVSDDMQPLPLMRETTPLDVDTDRAELTPRYTEEALRVLKETEGSDKPFFLYCAYSYPHDPARGSKRFAGKSAFGDFGDAVEEIDWSVGKIMDALGPQRAANTIVIFTSDHGPWFQGSPGLLRGRKGTTFEGGVRVPFLVKWPGHVPKGHVCEQWTGHLDVLPTLAAWCGLKLPEKPLDGHVRTFRETGPAADEKAIVYFSPAGPHNNVQGIRKGDWKLRVAQNDGETYINDHTQGQNHFWLPKPELYHVRRDPLESYDAGDRNPQVVAALMDELRAMIKTFPEETQQTFAELQTKVASVVTPPGASPRVLKKPQADWEYEPADRKPVPIA